MTRVPARVLVALLLLLAACGTSVPAPDAGRSALASAVDASEAPRLQIVAFRKTNGQSAEFLGVKVYSMDFTAEAEFREDALYNLGGPLISQTSTITTAPYRAEAANFSCDDWLSGSQGYRRARRGDRLKLSGQITFENTERGWRNASITFSVSHDSSSRTSQGK